MSSAAPVGIIANPFSGKDIRRLVAYGSTMDNLSKVRILQRLLAGLIEAGVRQILYMPDPVSLLPSALEAMRPADRGDLLITPVLETVKGESQETAMATAEMVRRGAGAIVTLGGDGTNRLVASESGSVPIMPLSTGTNNTFPFWVEPTIAGLAAGTVAVKGPGRGCRREKLLRVTTGEHRDLALVDVALLNSEHIGAGAIWAPASIRELVVTQGARHAIGLSAIAGQVCPVGRYEPAGAHLVLGPGPEIRAPYAPGRFASLSIAGARRMALGESVVLGAGPGMLAFDGERLRPVPRGVRPTVELLADGPVVIDPVAVLEKS